MIKNIAPFLWFDEQAEEAARFYTSIFQNSRINGIAHFGDHVPGPKGKVITVDFTLCGQDFIALNGGPEFSFNPAISFFVNCQNEAEIDALWNKLSEGGSVLMELGPYPFSEKFGWLADKYGVTWQLSLNHLPQSIAPCLLFVGAQNGKAEQAIREYVGLFQNSHVDQIERYGKGEGETEGAVKHARFTLNGQPFIAMDSGLDHHFTFTPAISLYVNCDTQEEVDHLWDALTTGGQEVQCGWLADKYGVSWQIVPGILLELMHDPDAEKANRVTQAMLKMKKIEINQLVQAYEMA